MATDRGRPEYEYGYRASILGGTVGHMTTPVPTPLRPVERGLTAVLAVAGLVSLAWVCAMLYVVFTWVVAAA